MGLIKSDSRIAGVTFANDVIDGGESRQTLLQQLYLAPSIVSLVHTKFFNTETNEEEDAIKVISDTTGKCLGYIPREDIKKMWNVPKMVLTVNKYKDTYSGALNIPVPPTAKQYAYVKAKRDEGLISEMPAYDRTIYQKIIGSI